MSEVVAGQQLKLKGLVKRKRHARASTYIDKKYKNIKFYGRFFDPDSRNQEIE